MLDSLKFAFRSLRKTPSFTLVAILALALGIGANSAIFSIINAIFLRPLPYAEPERIVTINSSVPERNLLNVGMSYPRSKEIIERQQVFSDVAMTVGNAFTVTGAGDPEQVQGLMVTHNLFSLLGVQPEVGRVFLPEEDRPGGPAVVLLSHAYWQQHYGGASNAVGQSITLDGKPHTIVGVLPKSLTQFPLNQVALWAPRPAEVPFLTQQQIDDGGFFFNLLARLKPGVTIEQARTAVATIAAGYQQAHAKNVDSTSKTTVDLWLENLVGNQRQTYVTLFAAVGCVLLIACANVANLVLARFSRRRKEVGIRFAIGARRSHVVAQFLAESLLLSIAGGLVGLVIAYFSLQLVAKVGGNFIPRADEISLDAVVVLFTLGVSLAAGVALGVVPALQASEHEVNDALKDSSRDSTGDRRTRFRSALLIGEVAMSFVLLIATGLLIASFVRIQNVSPGFDPKGIFTGFLVAPPAQYPPRTENTANFYARLYHRLATIPGAKSVALSDNPPLSGGGGQSPFAAVGNVPPMSEQPLAIRHLISPNRFATLGIPVKLGRDFDERDTPSSPAVAIINETMAKQLFPGENPIGRKMVSGMAQWQQEIVGVVADSHTASLTQAPVAEMFYPVLQRPENFTAVLVKTDGDPTALAASVRAALREVDPGIPLTNVGTMENFVAQSMADRRLTMTLLIVFAGLALVLASLGVYSVMAYSVAQRRAEIGIRMALGAQPGDVRKMVITQGMKRTGLGLAIGLAAALGLTRLMNALLFEVQSSDPAIYLGITVLLALVAALACWIPSTRAARVDPMKALRGP
jgi:putative ABC transport system permease protein